MKKIGLIVGLLICTMVICSCADKKPQIRMIPPCDRTTAPRDAGPVGNAFQPLAPDTCIVYLSPFDQAGWWESNLNSRRVRGQSNIRIGCTHCPAGNKDCKSPNNCGGCGTASLYFDFSRIKEDAEIVSARIALYALENTELLAKAIFEGRVNVGGDFAVVAQDPKVAGNWVLFDITPFACRSVVERRNSASFDVSLPCGVGRAGIATMALSGEYNPVLILEYR